MWPFTPKTLYDRYSKLMKLIMSIDSHFEVTENKKDSVRLHLPNYKGNQPMDFHIYLLEPFLFFSFVTEIDGEKISVLNNYHQDTDQQDIFNMAMASNLNRIHQVANEKYKDEIDEEINNEIDNYSVNSVTQLTDEQRYVLYYFVNAFAKELCDMGGEAASKVILQLYKESLNLDDYEVSDIHYSMSFYHEKEYIERLKTINDDKILNQFIYTCVEFLDLIKLGAILVKFFDILKALGWSEDEMKERIRKMDNYPKEHFYDKLRKNSAWDNLEEEEIEGEEKKKLQIDSKEPAIVDSWSLMDFARIHGKPMLTQPHEFINSCNGETFMARAIAFVHPIEKDETGRNKVVFVGFSSSLGELSAAEISAQKNELIVVQYDNGNYGLKHRQENVTTIKVRTDNSTTEINEEDFDNVWTDEYGVEYSSDRKILKNVPKEIKDYSILDGTEIIGNAAFSNCERLVSVTLPKSIKEIGHYVFAGCKKIFSIIIPDGVISIGSGSFMNCETLTAIRLPESLISIDVDAFEGCDNLRTIFVPEEEKVRFEIMLSMFDVYIGEYNSENVGNLDEFLNGLLDDSGVLYSKDGKTLFTHTKKLSSYTIKDGTKLICDKAFNPINGVDDCSSLKEINLPDTIVTIGEKAFAYNEELKEISLPSSINFVGKDVFLDCQSLDTIFIPSGSRAKFEKLLPELKEKLVEKEPVEKYENVVGQLTNFELPDGSIYNGYCNRKPFGSIELCGQGEICYTNGEKYNGEFKYGRPLGWGKYTFSNGHTHKGYFDSVPNGLGYLNENYSMAVGYFKRDYDGDINKCRLNGWGISYRNRIFKFGYWKNGTLVKDETNNTLWIRKQISNERNYYHGNLIQIGKEYDFIRFGIPPRFLLEREPGIPDEKIPKSPAWGFEFFKDGSVKVGAICNHGSGEFTIYYPDGTTELGKWKDGVKTFSLTIDELQKSEDDYEVDGLDVF